MDKVCSLYMCVQNHLSFLKHLNGVTMTSLLVTYSKKPLSLLAIHNSPRVVQVHMQVALLMLE